MAIHSPPHRRLRKENVSATQWELMQDQLYAMYAYSGVLSLRLEEAQETEASI